MVLDATLHNTQHYKIRIKGKEDQSRENSSVVAIEKGAFGSPSTTIANFTLHIKMVSSIAIWYEQSYLIVNISLCIGLVSLFNGISTLFRLFNTKDILLEEQ